MSDHRSIIGRWFAAVLALTALVVIFLQLIKDNAPKGEVRKVEGYVPWGEETLRIAETIPVQNGGRIKPLSTQAGFTMLEIHGARSMKVEGADGKNHKLTPTAWLLDSIFRPELAVNLPTFRIDNSTVLENAGIKVRGKRDRYSYSDIEPGIAKIIELAKSYEANKEAKPDQVKQQTIDLAYKIRNYEALLGYMGFARGGVGLTGTGSGGSPDQRADLSDVMGTASVIRAKLRETQGQGAPLDPRIQGLLEQVLDAANSSKFVLFMLPPTDKNDSTWLSAGNAIMGVMTEEAKDPKTSIDDIGMLENLARKTGDDLEFRKELTRFHDRIAARAGARGEYKRIGMEADYYRRNWFLNAVVFFLIGTIAAFGMWAAGRGKAGRVLAWVTGISTALGALLCIIAIAQRCIIMQRPPVGNLYDTIIFIATAVVLKSFLVEWMTRRRFALGMGPILGTALIVLARRYELGDAKDHMDPLVAVLDSNFWLMIHVITITLGYSAGLLSAKLSCGYLLLRGLGLDGGNKDLRRSLTRAVYGMLCVTLFLSLVGTVLGGIWANYSWGRFWGWDPKENGALMIVLWSLAVLHARLGGYIRKWGLHLCSVFTACVVVFSWWHVNFLGVGLHNYGFTAGKESIGIYYGAMAAVMIFGAIVMFRERSGKQPPPGRVEPDSDFVNARAGEAS